MKRSIKIAGSIATGIIVFLLILLLLISSGVLNTWIVNAVVNTTNKQMNGHLSIDAMEGNLFSHLLFKDVSIAQNDREILSLDTLEVAYPLWPLLSKAVRTKHIKIKNLNIKLEQLRDGAWNINSLFPADSMPPDASSSEALSWVLDLQNITIQNLQAQILTMDSNNIVPDTVYLDGNADLRYAADGIQFKLYTLAFKSVAPDFQISNLKVDGSLEDSLLKWRNFEMKLPNSLLRSAGFFNLTKPESSELQLSASPFDLADVKDFVPQLYGAPNLNLIIAHEDQKMTLTLLLEQAQQSVLVVGGISDFDKIPGYDLSMTMNRINGAYWTHMPGLISSFNGEVTMQGQGFNLDENLITGEGQFFNLGYNDFQVDKLRFQFTKSTDSVFVNLMSKAAFGDFVSKIHVDKLWTEPNYNANIQVRNLNLETLTQNEAFASAINLDMTATGNGFTPETMDAEVKLNSRNSLLFQQPINHLDVLMHIHESQAILSRFNFKSPYLQADMWGKADLKQNYRLEFDLQAQEVGKTLQVFGMDEMLLDASLKGMILGHADSLTLTAASEIPLLGNDSLHIRNASLRLSSDFLISEISGSKVEGSADQQSLNRMKNLNLNALSSIEQVIYGNYTFENTNLELWKQEDVMNGDFASNTIFGDWKGNVTVRNLFSTPEYELQASLAHLDLSKYTQNDTLKSDINLHLLATGKGFTEKTITTQIKMHATDSKLFDLPISRFNTHLDYSEGNYDLKTFNFETPYLELNVAGKGDRLTNNLIEAELHTKNIVDILSVISPENKRMSGAVTARLSGPADSLRFITNALFHHIAYDSINAEEMQLNADVTQTKDNYAGWVDLQIKNTQIQDFNVKDIRLNSSFDQGIAENIFSFFASDSINGKLESQIRFKRDTGLTIRTFELNLFKDQWLGMNDSGSVSLGNDAIVIKDLGFLSDESFLKADGVLAFEGQQDFHLQVNNLNMISIPGIQFLPFSFTGNINALIDVNGSAREPLITGMVNIDNPVLDTLRFKQYHAMFNFRDELFSLQSYLENNHTKVLEANLQLPVHMSFSDSMFFLKKEAPVMADVRIERMDLSKYNAFIPFQDVNAAGLINLDLNLSNTLNAPMINGAMALEAGAINYKKLGVYYKDIHFNSRLDKNVFLLDSLAMRAGTGNLSMKGFAEFASVSDMTLKQLDFSVKGNSFKAFDSELIRAVINTDLAVAGPVEHPVFSGLLNVSRSSINTDIFLKEFDRVYDNSDMPMLVVAQRQAEEPRIQRAAITDSISKSPPDIYRNLTGQFDIDFPRNTWIKGKNMNFELGGKLQAIKKGAQIDLFGTMNVKRGYYKIYGRRLEFEEGEITFTGGKTIDPGLNFSIVYEFRDTEGDLKELNALITGKTSSPTIRFFLNETSIEEKDAISYLLFNRSVNQLDKRESATVNSNLSIAKDLALGQISNYVKDALQSSLGLDVIEISGESGWTQGNVSIGKYITNNLFLNYERTFALDKKDKIIEPEKITLEYQFFKSLFLQGTNQRTNSGFDLIFKKTWK